MHGICGNCAHTYVHTGGDSMRSAQAYTRERFAANARRNLRKAWESVRPEHIAQGALWYTHANLTAADLARESGLTIERTAGVIAVLSPRCTWNQNIRRARACLQGERIAGLPLCARKAEKIRDGANVSDIIGPNSPKVRAFWRAILLDPSACVIDTWILRAARIDAVNLTAVRYAKLAGILTRQALAAGLSPAEYQAALWCATRGKAE